MKKRIASVVPYLLSMFTLAVAAPLLAEVRYVPVPMVGAGLLAVKVEYERANEDPRFVEVTKVAEGIDGTTVSSSRQQVFIGPSTKRLFPLLNITPSSPGLVLLDSDNGLRSNEVAMEVGKSPLDTGWELPLLSEDNDFNAGSTAFVQALQKVGADTSNLSIYNLSEDDATCSFKVLRFAGTTIEERTGISVKPLSSVRFDDVLRRVAANGTVHVSVTCNKRFYALGALPNANRTKVRVYYPARSFPTTGTRTQLITENGNFLTVIPTSSSKIFEVPLEVGSAPGVAGPLYRSLSIEFEVRTQDPDGFSVIRNIVGMFRFGGRRFNKTLFFGSFDRVDATGGPRLLLDLGTPYIETTNKRAADFTGIKFLKFKIELNTDRRTLTYLVTNLATGAKVVDITTGLFAEDLNAIGSDRPLLEFGLPGISDGAYFPPFNWKFSKLNVSATR